MTLKYESEILFDLMKRDGDDAPSDVLPYESELKEKYLEQVEGAYPKLQDYRSEWLNYNLNAYLPAEFPLETLSNVTEATVDNVVPYFYKSAVLKGNTLVNLIGEKREYDSLGSKTLYGWEFMLPYKLTSGKNYLAIFDVSGTIDESNSKVYLMDNGFNSDSGNTSSTVPTFSLGHNVVKCIATNNEHKVLRIRTTYNTNEKFTVSNVMFIEYQEGMENWDIPYFEGMQSVKMPVLKTTGKNTFNIKNTGAYRTDWYSIPLELSFSGEIYVKGTDSLPSDFRVNIFANNREYMLSNSDVKNGCINSFQNVTAIDFHCPSLSIVGNSRGKLDDLIANGNIVVELGGEPYKSNILTVNENVPLRSNGSVYDELDLLTGKLTQHIDEDGSVLTQEVVKTVDLTVTDQDGNTNSIIRPIEGTMHVSTSSQTLPPLLDMSVPVEATTQNLMSFANIVEEEK